SLHDALPIYHQGTGEDSLPVGGAYGVTAKVCVVRLASGGPDAATGVGDVVGVPRGDVADDSALVGDGDLGGPIQLRVVEPRARQIGRAHVGDPLSPRAAVTTVSGGGAAPLPAVGDQVAAAE